jgi:hypothetical protein
MKIPTNEIMKKGAESRGNICRVCREEILKKSQ